MRELLAAVVGKPGWCWVADRQCASWGHDARKFSTLLAVDFFTCGGFGDDHYDRDDEARLAAGVRGGTRRSASRNSPEVWVIGGYAAGCELAVCDWARMPLP